MRVLRVARGMVRAVLAVLVTASVLAVAVPADAGSHRPSCWVSTDDRARLADGVHVQPRPGDHVAVWEETNDREGLQTADCTDETGALVERDRHVRTLETDDRVPDPPGWAQRVAGTLTEAYGSLTSLVDRHL